MKRSTFLILLIAGLFGSCPITLADSYTFTPIQFPGAINTYANAINNRGQVAGYSYGNQIGSQATGGFIYENSTFTQLNDVSAYPVGINNAGALVGDFPGGSFLYSNGVFTTISVPGHMTDTLALGINDLGQIVGGYGGLPPYYGFLDSGGVFTTIIFPGAGTTRPWAINNAGQIVGWYTPGNLPVDGFLYDHGTFTTISVPGASNTYVEGINNVGQIVGFYDNASGTHGFIDTQGVFTTYDVPGAGDTVLSGINDAGQLVGYTVSMDNSRVGFLATPIAVPEVSSLFLLVCGLAGIGAVIRVQSLRSSTWYSDNSPQRPDLDAN